MNIYSYFPHWCYVCSLPKVIKRRVHALKNLQVESHKVEAKFYEEVHELERKYSEMYKPLFEKVCEIYKNGVLYKILIDS